jgi:hypothetical protein
VKHLPNVQTLTVHFKDSLVSRDEHNHRLVPVNVLTLSPLFTLLTVVIRSHSTLMSLKALINTLVITYTKANKHLEKLLYTTITIMETGIFTRLF